MCSWGIVQRVFVGDNRRQIVCSVQEVVVGERAEQASGLLWYYWGYVTYVAL